MKQPIVIIGIGEMGGVFARGFLRSGYPVFPVTRLMDMGKTATEVPDPVMVLVAVAENDLHPVLETMPDAWTDRVALLQNELLPRDWERHQLEGPTVASVWFEKKKGKDVKVIIPTPVHGPHAGNVQEALESIDIPARVLKQDKALLFELVRKNLYILTSNICGLVTGGTVGELWREHTALALEVAAEILDLQAWLTSAELPREQLIDGMVEAFEGDPEHQCMGRSAPARLERALELTTEAGLAAVRLHEIQAELAGKA
jgi:hypothetical protein